MEQSERLKVIITGSTGMVGEGVANECLLSPLVAEILLINRKPSGFNHPKIKEIIYNNLFDLSPIKHLLSGYTACFYCLGTTSVGKNEPEYYLVTYSLTLAVAKVLSQQNPDMTFCYISGAGTDSTEKGKTMWARVKGKTENDLMKLPFRDFYAFRPGFLHPVKGLKKTHVFYKYILWLYPIGRFFYPSGFCTLNELAKAMIYVGTKSYDKQIIKGKDIILLAKNL